MQFYKQKTVLFIGLALVACFANDTHPNHKEKALAEAKAHHEAKTTLTPEQTFHKLLSGNTAFATNKLKHPHQSTKWAKEISKEQHPFAVVVTCSDSRVAPEVLFDQGLGDLFVVRTAGEVVGDFEIGSIEYAVSHLGSALIVVMGHERCGAVKATIAGDSTHASVESIFKEIQPAVDAAKNLDGDFLDNAIKLNVKLVAAKISKSPVLKSYFDQGKLKIVGAYYDLDDRLVKSVQ